MKSQTPARKIRQTFPQPTIARILTQAHHRSGGALRIAEGMPGKKQTRFVPAGAQHQPQFAAMRIQAENRDIGSRIVDFLQPRPAQLTGKLFGDLTKNVRIH